MDGNGEKENDQTLCFDLMFLLRVGMEVVRQRRFLFP